MFDKTDAPRQNPHCLPSKNLADAQGNLSMNPVQSLQRAYQTWHESRAGDPSVWLDLLSDDVVIRSLGETAPELEFASARNGRVHAMKYFADLTKHWEMNFIAAEQFIVDGEWVVVRGRCGWKCRATNKSVESPIVHIFRFLGGKIAEFHEFYDTAKAVAATSSDGSPEPA
jgi:ketosteroid isomerase-like protein